MTANVTIEVARREDALRVPNAALRFRPTADIFATFNQTADVADRRTPGLEEDAGQQGQKPSRAAQSTAGAGRSGNASAAREELAERLAAMPAERRDRLRARMAERGQSPAATPGDKAPRTVLGAATTIDSLFGPLPATETRGRVWLLGAGQLKPVNVRLGISDGAYTELLGTELQPGTEVVTAVTLDGSVTADTATGRSPLMGPDRRRPGR
jgi:HlyD family secretion protein